MSIITAKGSGQTIYIFDIWSWSALYESVFECLWVLYMWARRVAEELKLNLLRRPCTVCCLWSVCSRITRSVPQLCVIWSVQVMILLVYECHTWTSIRWIVMKAFMVPRGWTLLTFLFSVRLTRSVPRTFYLPDFVTFNRDAAAINVFTLCR